MNKCVRGFALSLGIIASAVHAERMLTVDGTEVPLSELMSTCQGLIDQPDAQFACFSDLTRLMDEQSGQEPVAKVPVPEALDALRSVAQYQDNDSGLTIAGTDCTIQIVYYNNYFHVSRRNISEIDLFSATFDVSQLQYDTISEIRGAKVPLIEGELNTGSVAVTYGGAPLDSAQNNFSPRPPSATLDVYAAQIMTEIPAREGQSFEFVLIHPQRSGASAEIWDAFETFVDACKG